MKFSKLFVGIFCAICLVTASFAQTITNKPALTPTPAVEKTPWNFYFGGGGSTAVGGNYDSTIGVQAGLGYQAQILLPVEFGLRQSVGYTSTAEDAFKFSSQAYIDAELIRIKRLSFAVGPYAGLNYGTRGEPTWEFGPELVAKFDLTKNSFLFGRAQYGLDASNIKWDKGGLGYFLGLGIKF